MPEPPTLYERLGGVYPIATVVDDFIDRIMVDPRLNANPRVDEAHHRVPPGIQIPGHGNGLLGRWCPAKIHRTLHVRIAQRMKITGPEWDAFMDDFQQTLDKFSVSAEEQAELKAIVNSMRSDIVVDSAIRASQVA